MSATNGRTGIDPVLEELRRSVGRSTAGSTAVEAVEELADLSRATAEQLTARGEALLSLGRRLLEKAGDLDVAAAAEREHLDGERAPVGRGGRVTVNDAVTAARRLGAFTRQEFITATGLSPAAGGRMLQVLVENQVDGRAAPIVVRDGRQFAYVPPPDDSPASRSPQARSVERSAGVGADAPARGEQVAHTRTEGRSGKPGRDKKRAERGVRVRRGRVGS